MKTVPRGAVKARAAIASARGYLALLLLLLYLLAPRVDHPSDDMIVASCVGAGVAFGLALSGARLGTGGGRLAAWIALGILAFFFLIVLAASLARWGQVP